MHNPERGVPNASRKRSMFRSTASCSSPSPWRRLRLPYGPSEVPPCRVENPCGAAIPETVRSRRREVILIVAFLDPEVAALHQPLGDSVYRASGRTGDDRITERLEPHDQLAALASLHNDEDLLPQVRFINGGPHQDALTRLVQAACGLVENDVAVTVADYPFLQTVYPFQVTLQSSVRHLSWPFQNGELRNVFAPVDERLVVERLPLLPPLESVLGFEYLGRSLALLQLEVPRQECLFTGERKILRVVGGQQNGRPLLQPRGGQIEERCLQQAVLLVALLWPWVGKVDHNAGQRVRCEEVSHGKLRTQLQEAHVFRALTFGAAYGTHHACRGDVQRHEPLVRVSQRSPYRVT